MDELWKFQQCVNNIYMNIKFTMEIETNSLLPFLDTSVTKELSGSLA
jgi:hypothetical protein